jgi:outer membrane protein OmpA-like peptidoglycan-associated protein
MRKTIFTYLVFVSALFCIIPHAYPQAGNGFDRAMPHITAYFLRENIIIEPEATFFNVVVIKNLGEYREEVVLDLNVPIGWGVVASENRSFFIDPGDSVMVPVRSAPAKEVEGEIGYSVIAAINNRGGETLTNAYSFVKIPRKSDLHIRPITRMSLFDQLTNQAEFSLLISNRGNVSELVFLVFESSRNISIPNEKENTLGINLMVRAKSDTIIRLNATRLDEASIRNGSIYRVDLRATSQDQVFNTSFWFDKLDSRYRFAIPESEKILVVELAAQNLLSGQGGYLVGGFWGSTLLSNNHDINYHFYKFGTNPNLLKYSRIKLAYNAPKYSLLMGDIQGIPIRGGFGKGAMAGLNIRNNFHTTIMAGRNPFLPIDNIGIGFRETVTPLNTTSRYSYSKLNHINSIAQTAGLGTNLTIAGDHNISTDFSISSVDFNNFGNTELGYGLLLDYSGKINRTSFRVRELYGTTNYYGNNAGRHDFTARINQTINENINADIIITDKSLKPVSFSDSGTQSTRFQNYSDARLIFRKLFDRNLSIFAGPVYERKSSNSFFYYDQVNPFSSQSAKFSAGARISDGLGTTLTPAATVGYTFVTDYSLASERFPNLVIKDSRHNLFNAHISLNLRRIFWGTYLNYFYGPTSINQEISQFYTGFGANSIRVMPYMDRYLYRDIIKFSAKASLLHDFSFKTSRVIFNTQMDAYLKNNYTLSILNTYSYQLTTDLITEDNYTYSNNYFELRLKKEFNWNQPRVKYHDLVMQLFIDLNGNLVKDFNEPGMKDIIVNITSIDPVAYSQYGVDFKPQGAMVSKRFLTSIDGKVIYENLPRGVYKIELTNIGVDQTKFFPDQNEFIINLTSDQVVPIPYLERNKLFGRVIINRSRLTNLGPIEPSNIKITATDSKGRQLSTLSDGSGYFEMYVPSIDNYIVSINNIFRDHFTLRQNDFRASLNGFKQFEVNFVFDEIRRQIEFTPTQADMQTEIRRVGRTNLSGVIRDAATLQPIRATIEIVNNQAGTTIAQTLSERNSGRYTTSFVTGENYMVVVSANGYWMSSERLILDQFLTIQDAERDVLLESITIGARFQLNNLRFTPGTSEIPTEAMPELDRLIGQLRQNPNVRIRIEGHSDAVETIDNPNLSMQRAEIVMRYMVQKGYSNIEFTGLSSSRPVAPSDTEDNRRRNRRVEIIVMDR